MKLICENVSEAVLLAGGLGTRLSPLTNSRPKPLIPIGNYPLLDWNFFVLDANGINRVIIAVKYLGDQIREHIENITSKMYPNIEIIIPDCDSTGTANAVNNISNSIKSENFFVLMGDIVTNINLKNMGNFHIKRKGIATVSLKPLIRFPKQFGVVLLDKHRKINRFIEKPLSPFQLFFTKLILSRYSYNPWNLINSGVYCFNNRILNILQNNQSLIDFGNDVFPYLLTHKFNIYGYKDDYDYYWQDCGNLDTLLEINVDILQKENRPFFPKGIEDNGSWFMSKKQLTDVKINNPVALGNNVEINKGSTVDLSTINDNCQIGKNCFISGSSIWENVKIGDNVIIKDSVISNDVTIGDNCVIENESIIAPHVQLLPGTLVNHKSIAIA